MTPKEKAEQLVNKHLNINLSQIDDLVDGIRIRLAQENALITVNDVIYTIINGLDTTELAMDIKNYWQEVKQELEKLKNAIN